MEQTADRYRVFPGQTNAVGAWPLGIVAAIVAVYVASQLQSMLAGLVVLAAVAVLAFLILGHRVRDIATVDTTTRTVRIRRRRAFRSTDERVYTAAEISRAAVTRIVSEADDEYAAEIRFADGRRFDLSPKGSDQAAVGASAKAFLEAIGRDDLQVQHKG